MFRTVLGLSVWFLIGFQFLAGIVLYFGYDSTVGGAHTSVQVMRDSSWSLFIASSHYWASALTILLAGCWVILLLWSGEYGWKHRRIWWSALGALILCLALQMTGNLLPGSQHDVRTAFAEASIAKEAPIIGNAMFNLTLGGERVAQPTIDRWYLFHRIIGPLLLVVLGFLGIGTLRKHSSRSHYLLALAPLIIAIVLAVLFSSPFGPTASAADFANSATKPMWYVLPMHSLMNTFSEMGAGWVGSLLLPGLAVALGFAVPFFSRKTNVSISGVFGKIAVFVIGITLILSGITYGSHVQGPFGEPTFATAPLKPIGTPPQAINAELAKLGGKLFTEHGCVACHMVGTKGTAKIGPNLRGVGEKPVPRSWFVEFLRDPPSKGSFRMPGYPNAPEADLQALAEYLASLK